MALLSKIREKVLSAISALLKRTLQRPLSLIKVFTHSMLFSVLMLVLGLVAGFLVGARMFETGSTKNLKGASVKVSGPCRVDGEVRKPALAEDEVKVVSIDEEKMIGVVRATRETIECDLSATAIDSLPLLKDFSTTPVAIPEIRPFQPAVLDDEILTLRKKTIRASGTCQGVDETQLPGFVDQDIEVITADRLATDKSVIKITGIMRKTNQSVTCTNKTIKYVIVDPSSQVMIQGQAVETKKRDLVGDIVLVTSTCFPDHRLPQNRKSKIVFYPVTNGRVQITENRFDDSGRLVYLAGSLVDRGGAMIECDVARFPLSWVPYDASKMQLQKIDTSAATLSDEESRDQKELQIKEESGQ